MQSFRSGWRTCMFAILMMMSCCWFGVRSESEGIRSSSSLSGRFDPEKFEAMKRDVDAIVKAHGESYDCLFSVAVRSPSLGERALTFVSNASIDEKTNFAWGSITKMWTGASIMQLVADGTLSLDDKIAPLADAQIAAMKTVDDGKAFPGLANFSKLSDLYGDDVEEVTLRNLLAMQSGIPDFDTANPSRYGPDTDAFRATVYANPNHDYLEPTLMSLPWVATHNLTSKPGTGFHYSSTNFGILGLILSHHAGQADYRRFNQSSFLVGSLRHVTPSVRWAPTGSPRDHQVVDGFDRTDYNGQDPKSLPGVPVVDVSGVFAGYSAADFVGPPSTVAEIGYALWGDSSELVPASYRDLMVPNNETFYGLASQNVGLMGITGGDGEYARCYGHLGATYGYDSIFGYAPALDLGISIATNIETETQTQPSDAFCGVYNRVKNYILDETVQNCTYTTDHYYGGTCKCV